MKKLKATILSLSLVTVMSGAAVAPALGSIANYFSDVSPLLIKLIITLPSLLIIFTSLLFGKISSRLSSKTIAIYGLILYIIGGCGAGFANNIYLLLAFRILLGVGVGFIMPLSTGLIAYFFDKNEQAKLMGYSAAMNNLGGIIATSLSGILVALNWRYSFLIYLMGLFVMILVICFLPKAALNNSKKGLDKKNILKLIPYVSLMFVTMIIFYAMPSNFSMIATKENLVPTSFIGLLMSIQNISGFITGLALFAIIKKTGKYTKYIASVMFAFGFFSLTFTNSIVTVIIGLIVVGFGFGILVPLLNSQIPYLIEKENLTSAMALVSAMLYLGQFLSPIVIDFIQSLLHLKSLQAPFYLASIFSIMLCISFIKIPIKVSESE